MGARYLDGVKWEQAKVGGRGSLYNLDDRGTYSKETTAADFVVEPEKNVTVF